MTRLFRRRTKTAGLPPGTPVFTGERRADRSRVAVLRYDEAHFAELREESLADLPGTGDTPGVTWVNLDGVSDVETVEKLCRQFGIHPLVVEDVVNTAQRPKAEDYGEYVYVVLQMLRRSPEGAIVSEQLSIILGPHYVLSFQERPGDVFEPLRDRIRGNRGLVRQMGADYLAYALLDAVVDNYFAVFEALGDGIEALEEMLVSDPTPDTLRRVHGLKRDLIFLRKAVWPLRELLANLQRAESPLVRQATGVYLRDVHDHVIQIIDIIETYRDTVSGMLDVYLSTVSNRMNEVMKVLTVIATIFIPLTFVAGIYGMNFDLMPELHWRWGYFGALGVMAAVAVGMVVYFRRRRWL